jgi:hypothetical protein
LSECKFLLFHTELLFCPFRRFPLSVCGYIPFHHPLARLECVCVMGGGEIQTAEGSVSAQDIYQCLALFICVQHCWSPEERLKNIACGSHIQSEHRNLLAAVLCPNHPQSRHQIMAKSRIKQERAANRCFSQKIYK